MCSHNCCTKCCRSVCRMIKILFIYIIPSLLDWSTDILNGLDMIGFGYLYDICGWNMWLQKAFNVCKEVEENEDRNAFTRQALGSLSLAIVLLPGMIKAMKMLAKHVKKQEYRKMPTVVRYLPFPLYITFIQLKALLSPNTRDVQKRLIRTLRMQAFCESFPQVVLQTMTIMYPINGHPPSIIQIISILFSITMLTKTTIMMDNQDDETLEANTKTEKRAKTGCCTSLKKAIKYIFWTLPLCLSSIIYKVAVFSLTFAYLRFWALLTMCLWMIELIILAKATDFKDCNSWVYPVLGNLFIINIGGANASTSDHTKETFSYAEKKKRSFAKRVVFLSFFHHTLVLITIIILVFSAENLVQKDDGNTTTALYNFFATALVNTKIHWHEMHEVLYPYKAQNYTIDDLSPYNITLSIDPLAALPRYEKLFKENKHLTFQSRIYDFLLIMGGVTLCGLFNLVLIYIDNIFDNVRKDTRVETGNSFFPNEDTSIQTQERICGITDDDKLAERTNSVSTENSPIEGHEEVSCA